MNKTEQAKYDAAIVMAKTATDRADKLQGKIDANEVTLPFEAIAERIDGTNKFLLVIPSLNFSAQLYKRDNNTLVATKEYVHSEEETNSNKAVRAVHERKARYDALAAKRNVASQGDVPSAS